jgi:hypothetical protein
MFVPSSILPLPGGSLSAPATIPPTSSVKRRNENKDTDNFLVTVGDELLNHST